MIDIIITIFVFNLLIVVFKFFAKFKVDNMQALIVNYFVAGACGIYFSEKEFSLNYIINAPWIYHALIIGFLFIVVFNLYATGTQKIGIAVTTVANKLSLIIPVGVALVIYPGEDVTILKIIGFILAVIGIVLSSMKGKKLAFDMHHLWLIILVFLGQGAADSIFNNAQRRVVDESDKGLFLMTLLLIAGLSGILIMIGRSFHQKPKLEFKNLVGGIALGLPNFASLIFFFNALESSGFNASQVFPIISMGVVIVSALVGLLFFRENLTLGNWIGLGFAIASIYIITFY